MSIYSTRWVLQFPRGGDFHTGRDWVEVLGQGVPAHVGSHMPGGGYKDGDPYAAFLPPARTPVSSDDDLRAMVVVLRETPKGTARSGQEYEEPLLVLSGDEYRKARFDELVARISAALQESGSVPPGRDDL